MLVPHAGAAVLGAASGSPAYAQARLSRLLSEEVLPTSLQMHPRGDSARGITQFLSRLRPLARLIFCVTVAPRGIGYRGAPSANLALPMAEL